MANSRTTTRNAATQGGDIILGSNLDETFDGLGGDDVILMGGGTDEGSGGEGDDLISGGEGDDTLYGDEGDDVLVGDTGDDTMKGGAGNDEMVWNNGDGNDIMDGGEGHDLARVNGADGAGDVFEISLDGDHVDFERTNLGPFEIEVFNTETLAVFGQGGDDTITAGEGLADVIELKLYGGDGNDTIIGGDGDDLLKGGAGDDLLVGFRGNDRMIGGYGNDRMVWNNGDGSDVMEGQAGFDVAEVNGSDGGGDVFEIAAGDDGRVDFARTNFGNFTLDIGTTERLEVNGQGGDDTITGGEGLAELIELKLDGGAGNDTITGGDGDDLLLGGKGNDTLVGFRGDDVMKGAAGRDTMVWNNGDGSDIMNGGKGRDTAVVNGSDGGGDVFEISANGDDVFFARTNFGPFTLDISNTERLVVRGQGGDDTITGGEGLADLIDLRLIGGAGNDSITGGDGNDLLKGGTGNDLLVGFQGADRMLGGNGADRMVWNNGDGSDVMRGGKGIDTVEVNGSDGAGDVFVINGDGRDIDFARTNFGTFTLDISQTEVMEVNGGGGDDTITAAENIWSKVTLKLDGGDGNDTITGGNTDDIIIGGDGDDVLAGGTGNDLLTGGAGADVFIYREDLDTITDFVSGEDKVQLDLELPEDFDVLAALQQAGDNVVLQIGEDSLTFLDQTVANFSEADFLI